MKRIVSKNKDRNLRTKRTNITFSLNRKGTTNISTHVSACRKRMRMPCVAVKNVNFYSVPKIALNIDLAPTFLDIAGVNLPESMDGQSLLPILTRGYRHHRWRDSFLVVRYFPRESAEKMRSDPKHSTRLVFPGYKTV